MNERSRKILDILAKEGSARIEKLCRELCYSRSTIRRDLVELEQLGVVRRRNGLVSYVQSSARERDFRLRQFENIEQKDYIAKLAAKYVKSGMTIFMDSSTTVRHMLPYLSKVEGVVAATNGIGLASDIVNGNYKNIELFMVGGYYRDNLGAVVGEEALDFISRLRADICFISCLSVLVQGFYEASMQQAYVKKKMMQYSGKVIMLADSSKFGQDYKYQLAPLENAHLIISEKRPPEEFAEAIEAVGCRILY